MPDLFARWGQSKLAPALPNVLIQAAIERAMVPLLVLTNVCHSGTRCCVAEGRQVPMLIVTQTTLANPGVLEAGSLPKTFLGRVLLVPLRAGAGLWLRLIVEIQALR